MPEYRNQIFSDSNDNLLKFKGKVASDIARNSGQISGFTKEPPF
jgi:hypothetical protein